MEIDEELRRKYNRTTLEKYWDQLTFKYKKDGRRKPKGASDRDIKDRSREQADGGIISKE